MNKELRIWVDTLLLVMFPTTVLTGIFHGPRYFRGYWHTGTAFFLLVLVTAHIVLHERGVRSTLNGFKRMVLDVDTNDRVHDLFRESDGDDDGDTE